VIGADIQLAIVTMMGGARVIDEAALLNSGKSLEEVMAMLTALSTKVGWAGFITFLILVYPAAAISIKRRHDRNNSGIEVWVYMVLVAVLTLVQALGLGTTMTTMELPGAGQFSVPSPTPLMSILGVVVGLLGLYLLVVIGFLSGTRGTNAYGPDPLGV
jgi:uncharacterized membrane protein YhaH (DUF805 family)